METISILGIGRAGGALALALRRAGLAVASLIYRGPKPDLPGFDDEELIEYSGLSGISADVLVIATADPDIRPTTTLVSKLDGLPTVALHLSGSLASDELEALKAKGVAIGSMHPLVSISEPRLGSERFAGAYFCVEGDSPAVETATKIVGALGGHHFSIKTQFKPLYHAAAVMTSGHVTTLFDAAIETLSKCGLDKERAHEVLLPLLESTVANLGKRSTKEAMTGPFVRGDNKALERHLHAFEGLVGDDIRSIYLELAERSVRLAAPENQEQLLRAISVAKQKTGC